MRNIKGAVLAATMGFMVLFTLMGLGAISLSGMNGQVAIGQVASAQAFWMAEAGAAHAKEALKTQIRATLQNALLLDTAAHVSSKCTTYFSNHTPLTLLSDYGGFSTTGTLSVAPSAPFVLGSRQGTYNATITVLAGSSPSGNNPEHTANTNIYTFYYNYSILSQGTVANSGKTRKVSLGVGSFTVTVKNESFARYSLFFIDSIPQDNNWFTVDTHYTGPVHTNSRFNFAGSPNPAGIFDGLVTQVAPQALFFNNSYYNHILLNSDHNGNIDVPQFSQGFLRSQPVITLPTTGGITQASLKTEALGGTLEPTANSVTVPHSSSNAVVGGIFVKGDATSMTLSVSGNNPVYTITQGVTTKTVTVNYSANTTTLSGTGGGTYTGVPHGVSQSGGTLIYVTGKITALSGTVQRDTNLTISAGGDISINNHIQYQSDPRIAGNEYVLNLLGLISWTPSEVSSDGQLGGIRVADSAPYNLIIQGILMAPYAYGLTVDYYWTGPVKGNIQLLGGVIGQNYGYTGTFGFSGLIHGYGENDVYDVRMRTGVTPIYFPYTTNFSAYDNRGVSNSLDANVPWQEI